MNFVEAVWLWWGLGRCPTFAYQSQPRISSYLQPG